MPLDWAMTQTNLGNALLMLGERESGTARLEEAVAVYNDALEIFVAAKADYYEDVCRSNIARAHSSSRRAKELVDVVQVSDFIYQEL